MRRLWNVETELNVVTGRCYVVVSFQPGPGAVLTADEARRMARDILVASQEARAENAERAAALPLAAGG
jgi:hypothetical protein